MTSRNTSLMLTFVLFTSDHGEMLGSHKKSGKNVIETEAIAIPLIIHWPQKLKHKIEGTFFNVPDIMPTLLGLAGLGDMIPEEVDGMDFSKNLFGSSAAQNADLRSSLLLLPDARGIVNSQYTLGVNALDKGGSEVFLYDNIHDPYQLVRLKPVDRQEVARKMLKELGRLLARTNDPWYQEKKFRDNIIYP